MHAVTAARPASWKLRTTAAIVAILLVVSGCAEQMGGAPLTPAQAALKRENQRFVVTVGEGAIAGALLGAGIGYLAGGGKGALIGAASGGALGAAAGFAVAQNNVRQSRTEANLNRLIQEANADAVAYERSAAASAQIAADLRAETARLRQNIAAGGSAVAQSQQTVASYRASAAIMRSQINDMQTKVTTLRGDSAAFNGADGHQLATSASRIEAARRREAASLQQLESALAKVPTG
jgi:uncharacterized membrane protein